MQRSILETILGAFVLIVAAYSLVFAYQSSNLKSGSGYSLAAVFSKVDGVQVGTDVRLNGIKVGSVSDITLDKETYQPKLHFTIADDIMLPYDTGASITSDGLLGGAYVALNPGGEMDMLAEGDVITFTESPTSIVDLLGKFIFTMADGSDDSTQAGENAAP